jgi:YD repeat-containing protein
MYSPLSPNGGPDVIYESDLHSDESALGQRGLPYPCLFFIYSYETHRIVPDVPLLSECKYGNPPHSVQEELFSTDLAWGNVTQKSMDLQLDSTPGIQFRRFYDSGQHDLMTFGAGSNHTYNTYMYSDGFTQQTAYHLTEDDGIDLVFNRMDTGRGFNPASVYESHDDEIYGARISWDGDHYKLQYRDGAISTLLPCPSTLQRCYWNSYKDAKGHSLQFDRDAFRALRRLTASDGQGIRFELDDKRRTTAATATNGKRITYEYDAAGCLAKVRRADGEVVLYQYDAGHRMTSFSVVRQHGASPQPVLAAQYDSQGRVVEIKLDGLGVWKIQYLASEGDHAVSWKLTNPQGRVSAIGIAHTGDFYTARSSPVRFPLVARR